MEWWLLEEIHSYPGMASYQISTHLIHHQVMAQLSDWFCIGLSPGWCWESSLHGDTKWVWGWGEQEPVLSTDSQVHLWRKTGLLHMITTFKEGSALYWIQSKCCRQMHFLPRQYHFHVPCTWWNFSWEPLREKLTCVSRKWDLYSNSLIRAIYLTTQASRCQNSLMDTSHSLNPISLTSSLQT